MHPDQDPEVLVVGEALIDVVERGSSVVEHVGGSPANVALGLARLGVSAALLTQIGRDERGAAIVEHLRASGVSVLDESFSSERTSTARARIAADGQADYVFDIAWETFEPPRGLRPRVLHTGSIAAFLPPGADVVRRMLAESDAQYVTFDPNVRPALLSSQAHSRSVFDATARLAHTVKMSDEDAAWLFPGRDLRAIIDHVLELGATIVAITRGRHGALLASSTSEAVEVPAVDVQQVDTIGAGDTFMASLIHSLLSVPAPGDRLEELGTAAVSAAAITVSRAGADLPWAHEL
ncbi:carbohydrate kinase [Microbacterium sp. NPDC091313]